MTPNLGRERLLPPLDTLSDAPQLSSLALLELALAVVPRDLELHQTHLGALCYLVDDPPDNLAAALLAQLITDRCHELGELTAAYRRALDRVDPHDLYDDSDPPF